jgi:hypothetical protein
MKRRDLLKTAGTMLLTAPAVRASALMKSNVDPAPQGPEKKKKNLVVMFSGAFCFWQEEKGYKVMAPPVGPHSKNPHLPWAGTTANTKPLQGFENFRLKLGGYTPPSGGIQPNFTGTDVFTYAQEPGSGAPPLLNLFVPRPSQRIGILPTGVKIICKSGSSYPWCNKYLVFASGLSFVYEKVDLDDVLITPDSDKGSADSYKACFTNDADLQEATLTIHLTPLKQVLDPDHDHARYVWKQMLSMYPWMEDDIQDIDFCPDFDPSACPAGCNPQSSQSHQRHDEGQRIMVGPGSDCQVPIMVLPPGGGGKAQKSK